MILNETAANAFGWGDKAPGHIISTNNNDGKKVSYQVIGVVKDFHFRSLRERISPLVMVLAPNPGTMVVKLKTKDIAGLTTVLKKRWNESGVEEPLNFSFLDERLNSTYTQEQKTGFILGAFSVLTIFVACLGLF